MAAMTTYPTLFEPIHPSVYDFFEFDIDFLPGTSIPSLRVKPVFHLERKELARFRIKIPHVLRGLSP